MGENGTPIQIWTCESGVVGQRWFLTQRGQIQSGLDRRKCLNKVIDIWKASSQLQLWDCEPDSDQWVVESSYNSSSGGNEPGCSESETYTEDCHMSVYQFHG